MSAGFAWPANSPSENFTGTLFDSVAHQPMAEAKAMPPNIVTKIMIVMDLEVIVISHFGWSVGLSWQPGRPLQRCIPYRRCTGDRGPLSWYPPQYSSGT